MSTGQVLCEAIKKIRKDSNTTVIIFEHRLSLLRGLADRLVVLDDGKISSDSPFLSGTLSWEGSGVSRAEKEDYSREKPPGDSSGRGCDTPVPPAPAGISFRQVRFRYPGAAGMALERITLDFFPGEITVVTGQNGSGKTTLLKLCNGLLHPGSGEVLVQGLPVGDRTVATLSRTVGLLCQHADFQLFESTITDELAFAPKNIGMSGQEIARKRKRVVQECVLDHIDPETPPLGLSGGEKQRVAIAGLFMMDTRVVVLDEPTFGLDDDLKHALATALGKMRDEKKTVIVATHDEEFAALCADRYIRIASGRIVDECRGDRDIHVTCPSGRESGRDAGCGGGGAT